MNVKRWAESLRARVKRERVDFLVEWARKNRVKNLQSIYERAQAEFPMASEEKARSYAEAALRILRKSKKVRTQRVHGDLD